MSIGERAAWAILEMAEQRNVTTEAECERLGTTRKTFGDWQKRGLSPSAYYLQQMALAGYDVVWILTGGIHECK